jgi:hypothetical protein
VKAHEQTYAARYSRIAIVKFCTGLRLSHASSAAAEGGCKSPAAGRLPGMVPSAEALSACLQ